MEQKDKTRKEELLKDFEDKSPHPRGKPRGMS